MKIYQEIILKYMLFIKYFYFVSLIGTLSNDLFSFPKDTMDLQEIGYGNYLKYAIIEMIIIWKKEQMMHINRLKFISKN